MRIRQKKKERKRICQGFALRETLLDAKCHRVNASLQGDRQGISHIWTVESDYDTMLLQIKNETWCFFVKVREINIFLCSITKLAKLAHFFCFFSLSELFLKTEMLENKPQNPSSKCMYRNHKRCATQKYGQPLCLGPTKTLRARPGISTHVVGGTEIQCTDKSFSIINRCVNP